MMRTGNFNTWRGAEAGGSRVQSEFLFEEKEIKKHSPKLTPQNLIVHTKTYAGKSIAANSVYDRRVKCGL